MGIYTGDSVIGFGTTPTKASRDALKMLAECIDENITHQDLERIDNEDSESINKNEDEGDDEDSEQKRPDNYSAKLMYTQNGQNKQTKVNVELFSTRDSVLSGLNRQWIVEIPDVNVESDE